MDRFGVDVISPFQDQVNIVARMCERGHADKMGITRPAAISTRFPRSWCRWRCQWHYLHIHNDVIPALKRRTDDSCTLLVDKPAPHLRQGGYQ